MQGGVGCTGMARIAYILLCHKDPAGIIEQVLRGITPDTRRDREQRVLTIVDRREAILEPEDD